MIDPWWLQFKKKVRIWIDDPELKPIMEAAKRKSGHR